MKQISQQSFEQIMQGIVSDTSAALRDEAPQAYKVNENSIALVNYIVLLGFDNSDDESRIISENSSSIETAH